MTDLTAVLDKAEDELQHLIADYAANGRYADIPAVAHAAEALRSLKANGDLGHAPTFPAPRPPRERLQAARARTEGLAASAPSNDIGLNREKALTKYPRFQREGGRLVKISWSKSTDSEYEHRAGKAILDAVVDALQKLGGKKKHFSVEELGKVRLDNNGPVIPSYQVYLCLSWLRAAGLLEQNGRDGYTIPNKDVFKESVEREWLNLDELSASE